MTDYKVIDLENHFSTPLWAEIMKSNKGFPRFDKDKGLGYWEDSWIPITDSGVSEQLADLGEGRLSLMNQCGIDYAHLSFTAPGAEPFDMETSKKISAEADIKTNPGTILKKTCGLPQAATICLKHCIALAMLLEWTGLQWPPIIPMKRCG